MRGISWLAASQSAAQEGLCTVGWVSKFSELVSIQKSRRVHARLISQLNFTSTLFNWLHYVSRKHNGYHSALWQWKTEFSLLSLDKFISDLYGKTALNSTINFVSQQTNTKHQTPITRSTKIMLTVRSMTFLLRTHFPQKKCLCCVPSTYIFSIHNYINIVYIMIFVLSLRHNTYPKLCWYSGRIKRLIRAAVYREIFFFCQPIRNWRNRIRLTKVCWISVLKILSIGLATSLAAFARGTVWFRLGEFRSV